MVTLWPAEGKRKKEKKGKKEGVDKVGFRLSEQRKEESFLEF